MAALETIRSEMLKLADPNRALISQRFFKTGKGQYGFGDQFLGISVPQQRQIAKKYYKSLSLEGQAELLNSPWHEERLTALFMMVLSFQKGDSATKTQVSNIYISNIQKVNNWDLVDSSASYILGPYLENSSYKMKTLVKLAGSKNIWERRVAILTTFYYIKEGRSEEALGIIEILKMDGHDLIQKAVGWMLREIGKNCSEKILTDFLEKNAANLPRTSLRYAIERLDDNQKRYFMHKS